jgi:hypothetical protein
MFTYHINSKKRTKEKIDKVVDGCFALFLVSLGLATLIRIIGLIAQGFGCEYVSTGAFAIMIGIGATGAGALVVMCMAIAVYMIIG